MRQKRLDARGKLGIALLWSFASDEWAVGLIAYQLLSKSIAPPTGNSDIAHPQYLEIRRELEDEGNGVWNARKWPHKFAISLERWVPLQ